MVTNQTASYSPGWLRLIDLAQSDPSTPTIGQLASLSLFNKSTLIFNSNH